MDLIQQVREAGIIGAGGAGFPTHVKLAAKAEYVILNGAECEPLLRVDQQLLALYAEEIMEALGDVLDVTGAQKAYIGIKGKHKEAVRILQEKLKDSRIEVFQLEDFYPAGDEQALVYEVTKRVVPEASIPLKVGCVVLNVETALNIYYSKKGIPVTETWLTVAGAVPRPVTLKLPVGITIREVLGLCGVNNLDNYKVIDGGPMMGKVIEDLDAPITKASKGFIVLDKEHNLINKKSVNLDQAKRIARTACEQCRMCTDLCPRFLLGHNIQPHKMMRKVNYQYERLEDADTAFLCCECGVCELYACPVNLPPKTINILYKTKLTEKGIRYTPVKTVFQASPVREYRNVPVKRLILKLGLQQYDKDAPIEDMTVRPTKVSIALKQHIGAPAVPVVTVGQKVKCGQLIAEIPENALGARVHASIDGTVTRIDKTITIESV